jgi:hypoxanthine phosphoribosyltransferase
MISADQAKQILREADLIVSAEAAQQALHRIAHEMTQQLSDRYPLILPVMGGAVVFTGQLLPLLNFPLDLDTLHVSRYGDATAGGALNWRDGPRANVRDRNVVVVDDILDEGNTLAAIRERVLALGATSFHSAVFADKAIGRAKPIKADFVGVSVPNRYVFGFGMDVHGLWRNLPAVYALKNEI